MKGDRIGPGWSDGVLWTCAAMGSVPMALAFVVRERSDGPERSPFDWSALRCLGRPEADASAPGSFESVLTDMPTSEERAFSVK